MADLTSHHRDTLAELFDHQKAANIEWRKVRSLLEEVGTVEEKHNGKLEITVGPETETFSHPSGKDLERQTVVDLRRMLTQAGYAPGGEGAVEDKRDRDYGDLRWGKPT